MVAGGEGVDVEPLADADVGRLIEQAPLCGAEVVHRRDFHVCRVAVENIGRVARPFGDRRIVGEAVDPGCGGAPMGVEDERVAEGLRRLDCAQGGALGRRDDAALGVDLLDGVAEGRAGRRGAGTLGGRNRALDKVGRGKDARRVMNEDDVGRGVDLRFESGADALLAAVAARRRRPEGGCGGRREESQRGFVKRAIVGMDDDGRRAIASRGGERLERMADQRPAGADEVLLGRRRAEPRAASGRHDDEGNARGQTRDVPARVERAAAHFRRPRRAVEQAAAFAKRGGRRLRARSSAR